MSDQRRAELNTIIRDEGLQPDETQSFMEAAFRDGTVSATGTAISKVLPPVSRFSADGSHGETKQRVIEKLTAFFDRFFGLSQSSESDTTRSEERYGD